MAIKFTDKQMQEIERLALINCNSNTIAEATGIAVTTLKRRFGRKLRHWWGLYRVNLRESQDNLKETSPDMAKFLGKNTLGQVDKQVVISQPLTTNEGTAKEQAASKKAAEAYKAEMARGEIKLHKEA